MASIQEEDWEESGDGSGRTSTSRYVVRPKSPDSSSESPWRSRSSSESSSETEWDSKHSRRRTKVKRERRRLQKEIDDLQRRLGRLRVRRSEKSRREHSPRRHSPRRHSPRHPRRHSPRRRERSPSRRRERSPSRRRERSSSRRRERSPSRRRESSHSRRRERNSSPERHGKKDSGRQTWKEDNQSKEPIHELLLTPIIPDHFSPYQIREKWYEDLRHSGRIPTEEEIGAVHRWPDCNRPSPPKSLQPLDWNEVPQPLISHPAADRIRHAQVREFALKFKFALKLK